MDIFERWFEQDLTKKVGIQHAESLTFSGNNASNVVGVYVYKDGTPAELTGTVTGTVIRPDGMTVPLIGTLSGNAVSAVLTEACFAVPGYIGVALTVTSGDITMTVLKATFEVEPIETGTVVDPSGEITANVAELISDIETAVATIPASYSDLLAAVAPTFDPEASTPYQSGAYVWYDGKLYQFTANHTGAWTGTDAVSVNVGEEISVLKSAFDPLYITEQTGLTAALIANGFINPDGSTTGGHYNIITKNIYYLSDASVVRFAAPTGYAIEVFKYNASGVFLESYGHADIRDETATPFVSVLFNKGEGYRIMVGRFNNADSETYVTDEFAASILIYTSTVALVRYNEAQTLTDAQKAQALSNVGGARASDVINLFSDVTNIQSVLEHTDSVLMDVVENAIAVNGYEQQTGMFINVSSGKLMNTTQAALANCVIAVKVKPYITYLIQKSTDTVLRVGAFMTDTAAVGNVLYPFRVREAGATDPIEIYVNRNQYLYIQLWASDDPIDQMDVAQQLKTLMITPKVSSVQEELTNTQSVLNFVDGNVLVNGYTELENLYISATTKALAFNASYHYNTNEHRMISVPIIGGRSYRVWCSVPTTMRAGAGTERIPASGYIMSTKATKGASVAYMDVPTLDSDTYLYVQLFTDNDDVTHAPAYYIPRMTICPVSYTGDTVLPDNGAILKEINHRGYNSVAPENTVHAFRLSKIKGFNWVETDIRKTSDDIIVCLHDSTINRTARNADGTVLSSDIAIADITYADALNYDFGIWKSSVYAGTKIPTLAETLALCKAIGLDLTIEIKVNALATTDLIALVAQYGMTDHVEYIGSKAAISAMAAILHNGRIGLVGSDSYCDSNLRAYLESVRINGNAVYYHTDIYNNDATRRAILDDIAGAGFIVVSRVNSDAEVANAPTYSTIYMTNATHARQYLYDVAMLN